VVSTGDSDPVFFLPPGHANASFCPHGYGCRTLVLCEGRAVLDVTDNELTVTVRVPEGRWLWLVSPRAGVLLETGCP
jgi:hypothetical protein